MFLDTSVPMKAQSTFRTFQVQKMGLYRKIDNGIDKNYVVVSISRWLSKQNFHLKVLILLFF